mgnify:CR=1
MLDDKNLRELLGHWDAKCIARENRVAVHSVPVHSAQNTTPDYIFTNASEECLVLQIPVDSLDSIYREMRHQNNIKMMYYSDPVFKELYDSMFTYFSLKNAQV